MQRTGMTREAQRQNQTMSMENGQTMPVQIFLVGGQCP
jgi:hypothetical protein